MTEPENTDPPIDQSAKSLNQPGEDIGRTHAEISPDDPVERPVDAPVAARAPADEKPGSRRRWLRLAVLIGVALLLLFALTWKNCRQGLGLGGSPAPLNERRNGPAAPMATAAAPMAAAAPCQVRVDAGGIQVKGKLISTPQAAVAACAPSRVAVVLVTGDALFGVVEQLEQALREAGIDVQRQK